jgi:riboflavin kinase/FMN adenylyltransferase
MNEQQTIYALGFFDGVHLGHQALLGQCRALADRMGCKAGVVTFLGHPDRLVCGAKTELINTAADRRRLLQSYGMDTVIELPFDQKLMKMPYMSFFRMLLHRYGAAGMVCGADFRFGHKGDGDAEKLQEACAEAKIPCVVVPEQKLEGVTVSSTYIRQLLEQGDMERAARFLGHPHIFTGTVVPGQHLGRTIGVPTANLVLPKGLLMPKFGVYICRTVIDGKTYPAVTNLGTRPTVEGWGVTVEPWILDFEGDLYGKSITLEFFKYLRPVRKFPSLAELQAEIQKNAAETRKYFEKVLYNGENL